MRYCERGRKLSLRIRHGRAGFFGVTGCTVATRTDLPPLYLAVHHAVVVARSLSRIDGAICSLVNEEDGCTASCRSMSPLPWYTLGKRKNCTRWRYVFSGVRACLLLFQPTCENCSWVSGPPIADDFGCFFYEFLRIKSLACDFIIRQWLLIVEFVC